MVPSYKEFAATVFQETNSQHETYEYLMNEFPELGSEEAALIAIEAYEDAKDAKEYRGEQQSDIERGN